MFQFPGPFVFSASVENHAAIKEWLLPKITEKVRKDEGKTLNLRDKKFSEVVSSYGKNSQYLPELTDPSFLGQAIWCPMDQMFDENPSLRRPSRSQIGNAWFNYFEKSDWHGPHVHHFSSFSAIYLLHLEEKNPTVFCNQWALSSSQYDYHYTTEHLSEGSVIIFPSDLMHYVPPTNSHKRVTLSFNITSTYELG